MPPKKATTDEPRLLALLKAVPEDAFVQMLNRSGLTVHEIREAVKELRELKA